MNFEGILGKAETEPREIPSARVILEGLRQLVNDRRGQLKEWIERTESSWLVPQLSRAIERESGVSEQYGRELSQAQEDMKTVPPDLQYKYDMIIAGYHANLEGQEELIGKLTERRNYLQEKYLADHHAHS